MGGSIVQTGDLVFVGACAQAAAIVAMRRYEMPFVWVVPVLIVAQWFFMRVYASAENFTLVWFLTMGITTIGSIVLGYFVFEDRVSLAQWAGVVLILAGVMLTRMS